MTSDLKPNTSSGRETDGEESPAEHGAQRELEESAGIDFMLLVEAPQNRQEPHDHYSEPELHQILATMDATERDIERMLARHRELRIRIAAKLDGISRKPAEPTPALKRIK